MENTLETLAMLPSREQQNLLSKRSKNVVLCSYGYLSSDKSNDNRKFIIERIFGLTEGRTKIGNVDMLTLLVETGLYATVSGSYADIVGENNIIDIHEVRRFTEDLIATDIGALTVYTDENGERKIRAVGADTLFSFYHNGKKYYSEIIIYNQSTNSGANNINNNFSNYDKNNKKYAFVRTFLTGRNECALYELGSGNASNTFADAKRVPLTTIDETSQMQEVENTTLANDEAIFVAQGYENFDKIRTLVNSIDRLVNEVEMETYKHHDAYILFKNVQFPRDAKTADGIINKAKLGKMVVGESPDSAIEYITNDNPMIEKVQDNISRHIGRISAITNVPREFFGELTNEGAIGAQSRTLRMSLFFARAMRIRELISEASEKLLGVQIEWQKMVGYDDENEQADKSNK